MWSAMLNMRKGLGMDNLLHIPCNLPSTVFILVYSSKPSLCEIVLAMDILTANIPVRRLLTKLLD